MQERELRKTWVQIAIAAVIVGVVVVVLFAGGTYLFLRSHVHSDVVRDDAAATEFSAARARFGGQTPLIELGSDGQPVLHRPADGPRRPVGALHALGYDASEGRLSRLDLPGWFVRAVSAGGRIRLANLGFADDGDDAQRLTLEDLERHGPGLVLDVKQPDKRLLVWTE
ncbi:MAG TPA: hypothetical protein VH583_06095 [Vicinamibacterales bacterium]|jgi:hypothetical protein